MKRKAIFFDRDDTLIKDKGYMFDPLDLEFFPKTFEVLRELEEMGFLLFIVTNQSGIGRGLFNVEDMEHFHLHMIQELIDQDIEIVEIAFCPHKPDDLCDCRKPSPKMITDLCAKFLIDKDKSFMFGDKTSDLLAGENAGLKSFIMHGDNLEEVLTHVSSSKS